MLIYIELIILNQKNIELLNYIIWSSYLHYLSYLASFMALSCSSFITFKVFPLSLHHHTKILEFGLGAVRIACTYAVDKFVVVRLRLENLDFKNSFWFLFSLEFWIWNLDYSIKTGQLQTYWLHDCMKFQLCTQIGLEKLVPF